MPQVVAGELGHDAWSPFGWLPRAEDDPADGRHTLAFVGLEPHLNVIAHHPEEVARHGHLLRCDRLFRHPGHTQALVVLDGPAVVAVAAPGPPPAGPAGAAGVRAFVLQTLDTVVLHAGTWHWGPHPLGNGPVHLLNLQPLDFERDTEEVDLAGTGAVVDVDVGPG